MKQAVLFPDELVLLSKDGHVMVKQQTRAFEEAILQFLERKIETVTAHAEANISEPA